MNCSEIKSDIIFPTYIWSTELDNIDNQELKTFAYNLKSKSPGRLISGYGGWQSDRFKNNIPSELEKLVEQIENRVVEISFKLQIPAPRFGNIWFNINSPGSYNQIHNHRGALLSGVYYVDVPNNETGNIEFHRNDEADYYLHQILTPDHHFASTKLIYPAKTNTLYIFPAWLKHSVQGNKSNKDRISISFNYGY